MKMFKLIVFGGVHCGEFDSEIFYDYDWASAYKRMNELYGENGKYGGQVFRVIPLEEIGERNEISK